MKKLLIKLLRSIVVPVAASALIGTLLLTVSYCLPTEGIRRHVAASYDAIVSDRAGGTADSGAQSSFSGYIRKNRETFTDCIMVQYAFEKIPGKNAFEHAMWAYHNDFSDDASWDPEESLKAILDGADTSRMNLREYSRYWHGYLVYLKPLLAVLTWGQVIALGAVLQIGMMAAMCVIAFRRKQPAAAVSVLVGCLFMKLALMLVSVDMSVCWLIAMTAILVMLLGQDRLAERGRYTEFFLCVGILTSYFDFLTYPVVTLCFPLCVCFLIKEQEKLAENFKKLVGYCVMWGIGYAGMWACKWFIADLTLRTGTIRNALWTVIGITSGISGHGITARIYGGFHAIGLNLQEYDSVLYPALAGALAVCIAAAAVRAVRRKVPLSVLCGIFVPYIMIAMIPFVWIAAAQYHSALHARFTFRIISVAVVAGCSLTASLWRAASGGTADPAPEKENESCVK